MRNASLHASAAYNNASASNEEFSLHDAVKNVVQQMPLFTDAVAERLATKEGDTARAATLSSIYAKITQGGETDMAKILEFVKTQKKDTLYDVIPRQPLIFSSIDRVFYVILFYAKQRFF